MPEIFVFSGCNGSGKSTLALKILSSLDPSPEFVNADIIAARLNPDDVSAVAITASRLMLDRLKYLAAQNVDFAFETTLAARTFARFLRNCQHQGYKINLIYVWLENSDLAVERVKKRVASGGHNIPEDIIRRRYQRGRDNLIDLYFSLSDYWIVYNNSQRPIQVVAEKTIDNLPLIYQPSIWQQITK